MPSLLPHVDPDGLLEYSVVYTDRSLNHMSRAFQGVMKDISGTLKKIYHARSVIVVPGSGTFGMEAVARWLQIMEAYENGGHAYNATPPTDALRRFRDVMRETEAYGFDQALVQQRELGKKVRALLISHGFKSVAAKGFEAPGVVVSYTEDGAICSGKKFLDAGLQIAAGVPLQCDEPDDFKTFRIGLFGLDKLQNVD